VITHRVAVSVLAPLWFDMSKAERAGFALEEPPTLIRRRPATLEKRAAARLPIEMDVHVEGAAHRFQASTGDLSSGGMFVVTQRAIPIGANVMLGFTLPNGTAVEVLAVVKWQTSGGDLVDGIPRPAGIGLSFFCLEPEVKAVLESFCSVREALYYGPDDEHERITVGPVVTTSGEFVRTRASEALTAPPTKVDS
jgi:uncharacterized protein (TIGR02266 family)